MSSPEFFEEPDPLPRRSSNGDLRTVHGPELYLTSVPSPENLVVAAEDGRSLGDWHPNQVSEDKWQSFVGARTLEEQFEARNLRPVRGSKDIEIF